MRKNCRKKRQKSAVFKRYKRKFSCKRELFNVEYSIVMPAEAGLKKTITDFADAESGFKGEENS